MLELSGRTEGSAGGKYRNILRELCYVERAAGEAGCISYRRLSSSCCFCSLPPWNSLLRCVFLSLYYYYYIICYLATLLLSRLYRKEERWVWIWIIGENSRTWNETCLFVALFTRNPTLNAQASNLGLYGEAPLTKRSCDAPLIHCLERS